MRMRSQQASVLDHTASEIQRINQQLGKEARVLLDEELTLLRAKETALAKPFEARVCDPPAAPTSQMGLKDSWKAQHDNIVAAFRCGVTRVATLRAGGWGGIESGKYDEIGVPTGHHQAAHAGPADHLLRINVFHAEQFAYLLRELDAVREGDGTMLDSTVAIWLNELGLGPFNHHTRSDLHVVLAGGKNAGMRNASYQDLRTTEYQDFLFSLIRLMGINDVKSFGDSGSKIIEPMFS
jgi:hypothetical protein